MPTKSVLFPTMSKRMFFGGKIWLLSLSFLLSEVTTLGIRASGKNQKSLRGSSLHVYDQMSMSMKGLNETDTEPSNFCNGMAMVMNMKGFVSPGVSSKPCIIFLFEPFVMSSPGKYAAACILAFLIGFAVELLIFLRRKYNDTKDTGCLFAAKAISLFTIQLLLGYLVMLVAMTYHYVLLIMVILGFVLGRVSLNLKIPVSEDHCSPDALPSKIKN